MTSLPREPPWPRITGRRTAPCRLVRQGALQPQASQQAAVQALQLLQDWAVMRSAGGAEGPAPSAQQAPPIAGAYLHGPVGSGKTRLLDLFVATTQARLAAHAATHGGTAHAASSSLSVQRHHYHAFMVGVHRRLHELHSARPRRVVASRHGLPMYK